MAAALADVAAERGGARRLQLNEQMMVLWDGPGVQGQGDEAGRRGPARHAPPGLARPARGGPARPARTRTDANLHKVRIRLKDLRYGCETVALVDGGPARKTARAAERLQTKLGDLHDA